jgi:hypothetical protein
MLCTRFSSGAGGAFRIPEEADGQWGTEYGPDAWEEAKALLVTLVVEFPERKEAIVARVRQLWDEGYVLPEIWPIVEGEIRAHEPEIQAERAARMELIRDARVRRAMRPRDQEEACWFRLLDELDAIRAETGRMAAETDKMAAESRRMEAAEMKRIEAATAGMAAGTERFRAETDRMVAEADDDIDAQSAALRKRLAEVRAQRAGVNIETSVGGGEVVLGPLRPPPADSDHCVPVAVGGTEKKSPARTGRSEPQRGVRWWPFAKK